MKKQGKKTRIQYAPVRVIGGAKECVTLSELAGAGSNAIQWSPGALSVLDMRVYYADGSQGTLAAGDTLVRQGEGWLHALAGQPPRPVVGLWLQPPQASVTDVQAEVQRSLAAGKRAMVVELDGLSCAALQVAAEQGKAPFLSGQEVRVARTVFPCVSAAGLASIVTGATPDVTGVAADGVRCLAQGLPDMFEHAARAGLRAAVVEGDTQLIALSIPQSLNAAAGGDTDEAVLRDALAYAAEGYELLYVHFHGCDDCSHDHGPFAPRTLDKIAQLDGYVARLRAAFEGDIVVTADHGLHPVDTPGEKGTHGWFVWEDMAVPYIILPGVARQRSCGATVSRMPPPQAFPADALSLLLEGELAAQLPLADLLTLPMHTFALEEKTHGGQVTSTFRGALLSDVLAELGVYMDGRRMLQVQALDGYGMAFTPQEVALPDSAYLCFYRNGQRLTRCDGAESCWAVTRQPAHSRRTCKSTVALLVR